MNIQPTPNPDSIKITVDGRQFIESGMESFSSQEEAADHPLAERLFSITGVANVFILPAFLTVTKHPATGWETLLPKIESILKDHFSE